MKKYFLILIILGFLVYIQSLFNGFVWDDVGNLFNLKNLYDVFFYTWGPFFKPLFFILINLLEYIVGKNPFIFHLLQLLLHITNACLLFIVFRHFFKRNISFILSLVFLIHPGISEAVLWVSALQEPLFFLFGTVSLLFLLNEEKIKRIMPIYGFLLLSILSKETGLVFIALVLFYKIIIHKTYLKKHLFYSFLVLVIYLFVRVHSIGWGITTSAWLYDADFLVRLTTIPSIMVKYFETFVLPVNLQIFQLWWVRDTNSSSFIFPLILISILLSVSIYFFLRLSRNSLEKKNAILFFGFWFLFGLLFHTNLLAIDMTFAERWFYFPIVGALGLIGLLVTELVNNNRKKKIFYIAAFLLIILFSIRTFIRTFDWYNLPTLYTHDYHVNPSNLGTQILLADYYFLSKDYQKASFILFKAKKEYPENENIDYVLAKNYLVKGDKKAAKRFLLNTQGKTSRVRVLWGIILVNEDLNKAKKYLADSLKLFPNNQELIMLSAITEKRLGNESQVIKYVEMGRNAPLYTLFEDVYNQILKGKVIFRFPNLN